MATVHDLANTLGEIRTEMCRRLDEHLAAGEMNSSGVASMMGIQEWMASLEDAMRQCNHVPTPTIEDQFRQWKKDKKKKAKK